MTKRLFAPLLVVGLVLTTGGWFCRASNVDTLTKSSEDASHEDYFLAPEKRGERLFLGLYIVPQKTKSCVSCHNILPSDTLNWNPSAMAIANTSAQKKISELRAIMNQPLGKKMEESHKGYNFTDEELGYLQAYFHNLKGPGAVNPKPEVNSLLLFLLLGALITLALVDLFFTKRIKYRIVPVLVFLMAFGYQVKMLAVGAMELGRTPNYAPDQPIKFSHKIHATDNKIDCRYCHSEVDKSKSAGIPSVNLCLNCHMIVREGNNSGKFEINKIHEAIEKNQPVEWIRIHHLPDHVFFSHAQHVNVGKRECEECHGTVEQMHILRQQEDLSMGWCLDCHDKTAVDFNTNGYYVNGYMQLRRELETGLIDTVKVSNVGGRECGRCHY
ncbi:MAG: cytochrome c3 family protein [Marinifilaceae bacterium]